MSEAITQAAAYDLIDRFLRNNLYDDDYAKYSEALETISQPAAPVVREDDLVACLISSGCVGTVKMSFESGPMSITRPSLNATKFARAILALRPAVEPMTTEQRGYVSVPINLIRRAQNAINWHLEPNSPDEHEATMLELTAIGWPNDGSGITARAEGVSDGRST